MASPTDLLSDGHLKCSLCLEVFTRPVSTPCGHSFCQACVSKYWDASEVCQCPLCKKRFHMRPEIGTNAVLEELATQAKRRRLDIAEQAAKAWEVACDVCPGTKLKALKSCAVCFASYCETHLEPHLRVAALKRHRLIDPVNDLEDRMCAKHERLLELFCRSDQTCVCVLCAETDHKSHDIGPAAEESCKMKIELEITRIGVQQMMQDRLKKVQEIRQCVETSKVSTLKEIENSAGVFADLRTSMKRCRAKVTEVMEEKQRLAERRAEGLIKELEQEITELQRRNMELEQLSHTEDHIHFLQRFPSLCNIPESKDWSSVIFPTDLCVGTLRKAVSMLVEKIQRKMKALTDTELNQLRRHKADVTFDSNTVNGWLYLSEFGKRMRNGKTKQAFPDNPERFDTYPMALGNPLFSCGRHYWQVEVGVKHNWQIGVAMDTVKRKGAVSVDTQQGFYALSMDGYEYYALSSPKTMLYISPRPRTVGVYLDYERGQVSFYNAVTKAHIYTFTRQTFTGKLRPYFYLYTTVKKSEPMTICSITDPEERSLSFFKLLSSYKVTKPALPTLEGAVQETADTGTP